MLDPTLCRKQLHAWTEENTLYGRARDRNGNWYVTRKCKACHKVTRDAYEKEHREDRRTLRPGLVDFAERLASSKAAVRKQAVACAECPGVADGTRYALSTTIGGTITGTPICEACWQRKEALYAAHKARQARPRRAPFGDRYDRLSRAEREMGMEGTG